MKKVICIISIFLYFSSLSFSETIISKNQGLIWKICSGTTTIYLLGSIHLASKNLYPLNPKIEEAFEECNNLVVEIDINKTISLEPPKTLIKDIFYTENKNLKTELKDEIYSLLKTELEKLNIDIELMEMFKPWYLAILIEQLKLQSLGYLPIYGVDFYFLNKAKEKNKKILELETLEFQISLFSNLSFKEQELLLYYTLLYLNSIEKDMKELIEAWNEGDIETVEISLISNILSKEPQLSDFWEKLFFERNKNMASKIETFLKTKDTYFIIVGVGHLVGKNSIIQLLKDKGYIVKRL